jgi:hypothetical protein
MAKDLYARFRVEPGKPSKLAQRDPGDRKLFADREAAEQQSLENGKEIDTLQDRLYAEG